MSETSMDMAPLSDEQLIPGLQAGDDATLQVLIDRYWERAYRVALHLVGGDPGAAEDVAQETFVEAVRAAGRFQEGRRFRPWFFRLLSHTAADRRRARGRRRKHEETSAARADLRVVDAGAAAESSEAARLVREGLSGLEQPLREALSLRYLEGLSLAEVAQALEIPEGTVSSRVRRGLESLREQLSPALASLGVGATVVWIERALGERGPLSVPGAPAAAEIAAAAALEGPSELPPPAPPAPGPAALLARAGQPRGLTQGLAALAVGGLALAILAPLVLESTPPPSATGPTAPPPAAAVADAGPRADSAAGSPSTPAAGTIAAAPLARPTQALVASVASAATLREVWIASLPSDPEAIKELDVASYSRDNEQARRVGRLFGGYTVPDGAVRLEREDGLLGLELPPGHHLLAVGARGCPTQVHAVDVPASGQVTLPVELGTPVEPGVLLLTLRDHRGRPLRHERLMLGLRPGEGVPPLVVRKDVAPPRADDPKAQLMLEVLLAFRDALTALLRLEPIPSDGAGQVRLELAPGTYSLVGALHGDVQGLELDTPDAGVEVTLASGATRELTLTTRPPELPGADLLVRVIDRDGRPVPGARYELATAANGGLPLRYNAPIHETLAADDDTPEWVPHHVGPDGTRMLRGVPLGSAALIVREGARGGRSAIVQLDQPRAEVPLEVVLDQDLPVHELTLTVLDADTGAPIAGELQLRFQQEESTRTQRVTADAQGRAQLPDLPPGPCELLAWTADHAPCEPVSLSLERGRTSTVELRLARGRVIAGRVLTAAGAPSSGRVSVWQRKGERSFRSQASLEADGAFRLAGLPAGTTFDVSVDDVPGQFDQRFSGVAPGDDVRLELAAGPLHTITVVDEAGAPIPGAEVELAGSDPDGFLQARAVTDAEGRAALLGPIPPQHSSLRIEGPRGPRLERTHERHDEQLADVAPTGLNRRVVLRPKAVLREGVLVGRVVDAQGAPVAGAQIEVHLRYPQGNGASHGVRRTDAEGRFQASLPAPALATVHASQGRLRGSADTRLKPDARTPDLIVVVTPRVFVAGRVRGPLPAGHLDLRAERLDGVHGYEEARLEGVAGVNEVPFSLGHLAPGRWRISLAPWASADELASVELDLSDGLDRTDLVLEVR